MQQAYGIKVRPNGVIRAKTLRTSRQSSLTSKSGRFQFENECEVHFSSQPKVSEVASFGGFKGFRARQEYRGLKEKQQQCSTKEPHRQRQRSWSRQQQRTRQQLQWQGSRVKKRQRPQEQPKSKLTIGGNRHRPRRRSFWLSDTEIDMGAFIALQAKRVSWVDAGQEATVESCAHRQCQHCRYPRFLTELCWEVAQIHPCGKAPEFFLFQRPDPEASTCAGFGTFILLGATCAQVGMLVRLGVVCGAHNCRLFLKQAFILTFV